MPTLPTLTITNAAKWDRVLAAFHSNPEDYKAWLRAALIQEVLDREVNTMVEQKKTETGTLMDGT